MLILCIMFTPLAHAEVGSKYSVEGGIDCAKPKKSLWGLRK